MTPFLIGVLSWNDSVSRKQGFFSLLNFHGGNTPRHTSAKEEIVLRKIPKLCRSIYYYCYYFCISALRISHCRKAYQSKMWSDSFILLCRVRPQRKGVWLCFLCPVPVSSQPNIPATFSRTLEVWTMFRSRGTLRLQNWSLNATGRAERAALREWINVIIISHTALRANLGGCRGHVSKMSKDTQSRATVVGTRVLWESRGEGEGKSLGEAVG